MAQTLVEEGYELDAADSVARGSTLLGARRYDLVVADGCLPDGVGLELADAAQARHIPALIVTGYAFSLRIGMSRDFSRYTVLDKPVRPAELLRAVAGMLLPPR